MSPITITGPSASLWLTSFAYRVAVDQRSDPDRHAYFSLEAHAVAYLERNPWLPREVELSPRFALAPGEGHGADEPRVALPTAGSVAAYDYADGVLGEA